MKLFTPSNTRCYRPLHFPLLMQQQTVLLCLKYFLTRKTPHDMCFFFLFAAPAMYHYGFHAGINSACSLRQIHPALCLPLPDCRTWFAMLTASWQTSFQDGHTMVTKKAEQNMTDNGIDTYQH